MRCVRTNKSLIIKKVGLFMDKFELMINNFEPLLNNTFEEKPTFLNVIGKDYAEVYMSALVSYSLLKDENLLKNLIKLYYSKFDKNKNINKLLDFDLSNISSSLEKRMGKKRADIFVEITNDKDEVVTTITIENKTNTIEHSDQTVNYYNWVMDNFEHSNNLFFYLFPDYNESKSSSNKYYNLKYSILNEFITDIDDYIILDLKQHIKQRMEVDSMEINNNEKCLIDNFNSYSNIMELLSKKIVNKKQELIQAFNEKLGTLFYIIDWQEIDKVDKTDKPILCMENICNKKIGTTSLRLYKSNWYVADKFYLYIEIKFHDTKVKGPFDRITFQQTVRKYNNFSNFDDWKDKNGIFQVSKESSSNYRVLNCKDFNCNEYNWDSEEWKNQFVNQAYIYFKEMLKNSDSIYDTLCNSDSVN